MEDEKLPRSLRAHVTEIVMDARFDRITETSNGYAIHRHNIEAFVDEIMALIGPALRPVSQGVVDSESGEVVSRPMTGLIALLTDEQRARALAYDGDDTHGPAKPA